MSSSLTNALAAFMDLMNRVFWNYLDSFVIIFIDDVVVYSKSENEHMGYLREVLQVFKENQLFAKYSKCEFWIRSVDFLGHIVSIVCIEVDLQKTGEVKNWPRLLLPPMFKVSWDYPGII